MSGLQIKIFRMGKLGRMGSLNPNCCLSANNYPDITGISNE
jgi:hypothetical protein